MDFLPYAAITCISSWPGLDPRASVAVVRGVLIELPDPNALKALMDRGERDRELTPTLPAGLRDGDWLTLTVQVGQVTTRLPARVRELGDTFSLSLSERDWCKLSCFAGRCGNGNDADQKSEHPPSGVTAIVRGRVFVLAAESCLAKVVSATLASAGFDAIVSNSVESLLSGVEQTLTNVVILDSQVPDSSANTLCRRLHELPQAHRPSVLVLVASSSPSDGISALTCGADDYLLTPFRRPELLARVTSLLHRAQAASSDLIGAA
jgi:CheY-like chemotaxis protein